jgi:hypothetical protein
MRVTVLYDFTSDLNNELSIIGGFPTNFPTVNYQFGD